MKDPLADYQLSNAFKNGLASGEMLNSTVKDKKMVFIEPQN